jgi:DNA repair protein RadA/Sms
LKNKPVPRKTLIFGEVGLAGEIRPVQRGQERIREAAKLGFTTFVIPNLNKPKQHPENTIIIAVDRVEEALALLRE